jgi:hypothetical protein
VRGKEPAVADENSHGHLLRHCFKTPWADISGRV